MMDVNQSIRRQCAFKGAIEYVKAVMIHPTTPDPKVMTIDYISSLTEEFVKVINATYVQKPVRAPVTNDLLKSVDNTVVKEEGVGKALF